MGPHQHSSAGLSVGESTPSLVPTVVEAVAARDGTDPADQPPLHMAIDPDALDAIFQPRPKSDSPDVEVVFQYAGYDVRITADRTVVVEPTS